MTIQTITKEALKEMLDRGERMELVDVRPSSSYWNGHIRGARSIPFENFLDRAIELLGPGDRMIFYGDDAKDVSSERAAELLVERGFDAENITMLAGGLIEWRAAGYMIESGDEPMKA